MIIKGLEKTSFIDYPGKISTVIFTGGCNFRCPYCHNAHILKGDGEAISLQEVFEFLEKRKKFIDAVTITGGEPTLHEKLYDFISEIKSRGFFVKLDTNGTKPKIIKTLIDENLLDYIAMDIKAPFHKYKEVAQKEVSLDDIRSSIDIIRSSDIDYEFRTTVAIELLTKEDILEIAKNIKGSKRYSLQNFRDGATILGGKNRFTPFDADTLSKIEADLEGYFEVFNIRGLT